IMHGNHPSAEVTGIKDATRDWTPAMVESFKAVVPLVHYSFRIMVGLGLVFIVLSGWGVYLLRRGRYAENQTINRLFLWLVATPWVAIILGWVVAEVGRQPWAVYGLMLTRDAVSKNVTAAQVIFSLGSVFVFYAVLLAVEYYLLVKFIKRGPIENPFDNRG
ncbi:MAG: cytochrome ubiquinol oxidase subunit I, partial [Patescibacteria group bacterium]|nr:cytochrome ubiquinol oxidase subunit I [Patescibacteria group bacterium]